MRSICGSDFSVTHDSSFLHPGIAGLPVKEKSEKESENGKQKRRKIHRKNPSCRRCHCSEVNEKNTYLSPDRGSSLCSGEIFIQGGYVRLSGGCTGSGGFLSGISPGIICCVPDQG